MNNQSIKNFLLNTPVLSNIVIFANKVRLTGTLQVAELPQAQKATLILEYAKKYDCKLFVETGTYKGDTTNDCKDFFEELYSIELSHDLYVAAAERFAGINKIHILEGNSGDLMPMIMEKATKPTLFWLDAHYSGGETARGPEDSPVVRELQFIFASKLKHCILIDDARCFNGKAGYPRISYIRNMIKEINQKEGRTCKLEVKRDIIRITQ